MRWEQWVGLYLLAGSLGTLLLCGLVAWGNRDNPRRTFELPRFAVRYSDYLRSVRDCETPR